MNQRPSRCGGDAFIAYYTGYAWLKMPTPDAQRLANMLFGTEFHGKITRRWKPGAWRMHVPLIFDESRGIVLASTTQIHFPREQIPSLTVALEHFGGGQPGHPPALAGLAEGAVGADATGEVRPGGGSDAQGQALAVVGGVADEHLAKDAGNLDARSGPVSAVAGLAPGGTHCCCWLFHRSASVRSDRDSLALAA